MRGNPVREWALFAVAWSVLLIPVIKLTSGHTGKPDHTGKPPEQAPYSEDEQDEQTAHAVKTVGILKFTEAPRSFRISQLGEVIWEGVNPDPVLEHTFEAVIDTGHVEVIVEAVWDSPGSRVVELLLLPDGLEEQAVYAWADASIEELFVYHWHGEGYH